MVDTVTEAKWSMLAAKPHSGGVVSMRIHPRSGQDIFIAVRYPSGERMLAVRVPTAAAEVAIRKLGQPSQTRGIRVELATAGDGLTDLRIVLTASDRRDVFNPLATDVAYAAAAAHGPEQALSGAIRRFEHWRALLRSIADTGLASEARLGLYGELATLRDHLLPVVPETEAVEAWTGPTGTNQDFQLGSVAVEVKTTAAHRPQHLTINNERQLDPTGVGTLLLAHLSVDERRGGSGETINSAVDGIANALRGTTALQHFQDLLLRSGYLSEDRHLYDEPRYTRRSLTFWHVVDDFPRIVESDLRSGVGDCRYQIGTAGLERFAVPPDELPGILKGER
ncbi:PD-(D/E)XK motif protein [Dactylosporangium sp. NPDC000521]|uniref:PD-(D/E)XK motif protein n=1 Tax=Dactylosporangium sp. NPDC000521 TaxID=3363975 RepID=UPI00369E4A1F